MNHSVSTFTGKTKIKLVFLGNQSVGKSSVIEKYVHNRFDESSHPTVGIDFLAKNISHKNKNFRIQLWDTAGQERFKSLIPSYLKDAQCAMILFDVTNKTTFQNIQSWLQMYNENKTGSGFTLLIGNKIDLDRDRQVSFDEAKKKAQSLKMHYFQISAKTGQNIQLLFGNLLEIFSDNQIDPTKFVMPKHSEPQKIDQVEQKNEDDKEKNKQTKQNKQNKQTTSNILSKTPLSSSVPLNENKTIRLENKKQKPKIQKASCC